MVCDGIGSLGSQGFLCRVLGSWLCLSASREPSRPAHGTGCLHDLSDRRFTDHTPSTRGKGIYSLARWVGCHPRLSVRCQTSRVFCGLLLNCTSSFRQIAEQVSVSCFSEGSTRYTESVLVLNTMIDFYVLSSVP